MNGLSGVKKAELMGLAREHLSPTQLEDVTPVRSYKLTTAGRALLDAHPRWCLAPEEGLGFLPFGVSCPK